MHQVLYEQPLCMNVYFRSGYFSGQLLSSTSDDMQSDIIAVKG